MMATAGVVLKIRLEGAQTERQWHCSSPESLTFNQMEQKVAELYPAVGGRQMELTWKDSDGDLITFSSDEELRQLIYEANNGSVEIYVKSLSSFKCSRCGDLVEDLHYKCVCCYDYNLCRQCEAAAVHSHHPMVRVDKQHGQNKDNVAETTKVVEMLSYFWQWMQSMQPVEDDINSPCGYESRMDGCLEPDQSPEGISRAQERKRKWEDMMGECLRQIQELDIAPTTARKTSHSPQKGQSDGSDHEDSDTEDVWEDLMEEWMKEICGDNFDTEESSWQGMLKELYRWWSGADVQKAASEADNS